MEKYKIGYTQGCFDLFHIGHLNLLNNAKKYCNYLIVGINSDKLVKEYKNKSVVINENERKSIVENIKAVDEAIIVDTLDKVAILSSLRFDTIFIGDDWKKNPRWEETKSELQKYGIPVIYLPYTPNVSSSNIRINVKKRNYQRLFKKDNEV